MCDVIPIDQPPDCDSCKDPTKRIAGKTIDLEGPGKVGLLYDCDNIVCKRKCNAIGSVIVRQVMNNYTEKR